MPLSYADPGPENVHTAEPLRAVLRPLRRGLVLASAVLIAFFISGGVFTFTPLFGVRIAHTSGISMEPAYKEGDVVLIREAGGDDVQVGDVVVFRALGQSIMHRIIEQRPGPDGQMVLVTQGDNVPQPDYPIRASQVSGKLVGEIPVLGSLSRLIDADGGFYVYRSLILTFAVGTVVLWGLNASVRRRADQLAPAPIAAAIAASGDRPPVEPPPEPVYIFAATSGRPESRED
jgi:signal peptidase I